MYGNLQASFAVTSRFSPICIGFEVGWFVSCSGDVVEILFEGEVLF